MVCDAITVRPIGAGFWCVFRYAVRRRENAFVFDGFFGVFVVDEDANVRLSN
jgi:hypothetical protein